MGILFCTKIINFPRIITDIRREVLFVENESGSNLHVDGSDSDIPTLNLMGFSKNVTLKYAYFIEIQIPSKQIPVAIREGKTSHLHGFAIIGLRVTKSEITVLFNHAWPV